MIVKMMFSTLLLLGTGMWTTGLESVEIQGIATAQITPIEKQWKETPLFSAKAVLLIDSDSMTPVFEHNARVPLPMASLTKIMTALVIMESHSLDEVVSITKASEYTDGSSMNLKEGESVTVHSLLKGLMIESGNDAAIALARYHSGTVYDFVIDMNTRANKMFLSNTSFNNPHGLDSEYHYSTAYELAAIAKVLTQYPEINRIVNTQEETVFSIDGETEYFLENTNRLLGGIFPVYGVKTGTTEKAGQCLLLKIIHHQKEYFLVILGSEDRYQDARNILYMLTGITGEEE